MAETTLEERLISGTGVLRFPPTEAAMRYVSLLVDVVREPQNPDYSKRYNPNRQRYATMVFLRGGYVVEEVALDYPRRRLDWILDPTGQLLVALKCADKMVQTKLGGATSSIADFANLKLLWDEVRVVCHADTAVQLRLRMDILDQCGDDYSEKEPPPPPDPLPKVPPGTSIGDISPPYDDDDITSKDPIDSYPEPPPTDPPRTCTVRTVTISVIRDGVTYLESSFPCFGDIGDAALNGDASGAGVYCYGSPVYDPPGCTEELVFIGFIGGTTPGRYSYPAIVSIDPPQ